ncbi:MAG: hypothetical protein QOH04_129 [Sphingomonadales bacterium]|jgi:hypothetical protein|nr:hypothetical protein [Sphingomonadales bacterium]
MRRASAAGIAGLTSLALALVALAPGAFSKPARAQEPLCRRAAALAPLPPEARVRQNVRDRDSVELPSMVMPAPPAPPPPPPPPPPPEAIISEMPAAPVAVTDSRAAPPAAAAESGLVAPPESRFGRGGGEPQSGQLTAGDHDDLLNPELYARYVRGFLHHANLQDVPKVDTRSVLTVAVQDDSGRPVPFARVTLTCADGNSLSLATVADGTAIFYPGLDRLGDSVRLSVGPSASQGRRIDLAGQAGPQRQTVTLHAPSLPVRKFDLMLVVDTTGSMGDEMSYLKSELRAILADIARTHPGLDMRIGLVAYRDLGDDYVTRTFPFTPDLDRLQADLRAQYADGGGDMPEAMEQALARAVALDWRPDAVKSLLLVADAPPHDENIGKAWRAAEAARAKRIQIVPVAASGVDATAEYVMRAMAAATQSRYLFLTDDSGIGNPHAEPAVDCYLVTRLDRLVRRVLDSQISGRRVEPRDGEVIRAVGRYDGGKCVLPADFRQEG